jgi:hypothetical protein
MRLLLPALVLGSAAALHGADLRFSSGPGRTTLIELYTSEGCSSCPPADRWLGSLRESPGLWRDFVPVAFHVTYWDNLGWPDRFARRSFTERQYALAAAWHSDSVYTPCVVRDGSEWHPSGPPVAAPGDDPGVLSATVGPDGICRIRFRPAPASARGAWEAHVALLGGGYRSRVTGGENSGSTLSHEFVALGLADAPMRPDGDSATAEIPLPAADRSGAKRLALAAWVTAGDGLAPIQATGGWIQGG